jgi:hypothetical protein
MPITGPFNQFTQSNVHYYNKRWFRGGRATRSPLPFEIEQFGGWDFGAPLNPAGQYAGNIMVTPDGGPYGSAAVAKAYATAYDRFASKIKSGKTASLGVSTLEMRESLNMISSRCRSLWSFGKALRRFDLPGIYQALFLTKESQKKKTQAVVKRYKISGDFASAYLEMVFGWLPLIKDIGDAVEVLQSTPNVGHCRGRGNQMASIREQFSGGGYFEVNQGSVDIKVQVSADVSISNPNLALANQLGFVNPAQVAWDVIPLSFLVNWFLPISKFLGGFSAFWGFSIEKPVITHLRSGSSSYSSYYLGVLQWRREISGHSVFRFPQASLPVPSFSSRMKMPSGELLGKALSSIALLTQSLSKR